MYNFSAHRLKTYFPKDIEFIKDLCLGFHDFIEISVFVNKCITLSFDDLKFNMAVSILSNAVGAFLRDYEKQFTFFPPSLAAALPTRGDPESQVKIYSKIFWREKNREEGNAVNQGSESKNQEGFF